MTEEFSTFMVVNAFAMARQNIAQMIKESVFTKQNDTLQGFNNKTFRVTSIEVSIYIYSIYALIH